MRARSTGVGLGVKAGNAHPRDGQARRDVAQYGLDVVRSRPARNRVVTGNDPRLEHVHVERDIHRVRSLERAIEVVVDPVHRDVLALWRVEVTRADERDVGGPSTCLVDRHAERHPPRVSGGRGVGRVEIAVRIEPHDGEPRVARGEAANRAEVRATAAAQHERASRKAVRDHGALLLDRVAFDHERFGVREGEVRSLGHRLAADAPGAGNTHESSRKRGATAMALVPVVECDGRQRPTVRTACAERAHAIER
jgi:hypothetical protein